MNKKYDYTHWGFDLVGCICIIYLFICDYKTLLKPIHINTKSEVLTNVFIILNKHFGEKGVYLILLMLFLYFFISMCRKINKK